MTVLVACLVGSGKVKWSWVRISQVVPGWKTWKTEEYMLVSSWVGLGQVRFENLKKVSIPVSVERTLGSY